MRKSKEKISALMRGRRFIDWREAPEFARDLCDTLSSIREAVMDPINGDIYYHWLPVAEEMDKAGQPVAASLVYRALLLSILKKANTKAYPHAARYLRKLDRLAEAGEGRVDIEEHLIFKERLLREHGKKKSFLMRYEAAR